MSKLFEIQTIVKVQFEGEIDPRICSVRITATKKRRSAIWKLVVNDNLNPGVARYGYSNDSLTTITLTPYRGYDGSLVANMAYAFACITQADDWTHLFSIPAPTLGVKNVKTEGFQPDDDVVLEIQRLFVNWKAVSDLNSRIGDLKLEGINTNAIYAWNREAIECLRRAGGTTTALASIVANVAKVNEYAALVRAIDKIKLANLKAIQKVVALFEQPTAGIKAADLAHEYFKIVRWVDDETTRLEAEVDDFATHWDKLQFELMEQIRKATPPASPTSK